MSEVSLVDARGRPRVVVTGMGVKSPAGLDVDSMWATVLAGKGVARRIERFDPSELPVQFAGEAGGFDPEAYFGPKEVRRVDRFTQLGFAAAADAIEHAGDLASDPSRVAVLAATGVGGLETMETNEATFLERGASRVSPFFVPMMMPNAAAGQISIRFGFTGPRSVSPPPARPAPTRWARRAHDPRRQRRRRGRRRHRGPGHAAHDLRVRPHGCDEHPQRRPEHASRPFDAARDGFVIAEGAAFCILETLRACARSRRHDLRRDPRLRPQRRRPPHHRAGSRRRRRPRACSSRSTTPASPAPTSAT